MFSFKLNPRFGRLEVPKKQWVTWFLSIISFPLMFLMVKFANIFTRQDDWKTAAMAMTGVEGVYEGGSQLVLQLTIVFKRADREPSNFQIATLISSLMSCLWATIENIFAHKPQTTIEMKVFLIPYALFENIYLRMACALMLSTNWNMILFIILLVVGKFVFRKIPCIQNLSVAYKKLIIRLIKLSLFVLTLIAIAVLVNCFPETSIWNWGADEKKLSDMAIVDKAYFNYIFACCIISGFVSNALYYFQVMPLE